MQCDYLVFAALLFGTPAAVDNAADIKISPEGCAILGSNVTVQAYYDTSPTGLVTVGRGEIAYGSCAGTVCTSEPGIELSATSAANITLKILSVDESDAGAWRFENNLGRNLSVFNLQVSSDLKQVSAESTLTTSVDDSGVPVTVTWASSCVYSNISITWLLDRTEEITNIDGEIEIFHNTTHRTCGVVHESTLLVRKYDSIQGKRQISTRLTIEECPNFSAYKDIDFLFEGRSSASSSSVSVFVVGMTTLLLSATIV